MKYVCSVLVSLAVIASHPLGVWAGPAPTAVGAPAATSAGPTSAQAAAPAAMLDLGGLDVFSVHGTVGALTPQERVDIIERRLDPFLGVPSIPPDAVRVYAPPAAPPSIYVFGRRIVTVDAASAKAEGMPTPLALAVEWAQKLQDVLPQVNYRAPGQAAAPPPAQSPVRVVHSLDHVGGSVGAVQMYGKVVMRLRGVQPGGLTAAERADEIKTRLFRALEAAPAVPNAGAAAAAATASAPPPTAGSLPAANPPDAATPTDASADTPTGGPEVDVVPASGAPGSPPQPAAAANGPAGSSSPSAGGAEAPATLMVNGMPVITVDAADAVAAGEPSPTALAQAWAQNIQNAAQAQYAALHPPPTAPPAAAPSSAPVPQGGSLTATGAGGGAPGMSAGAAPGSGAEAAPGSAAGAAGSQGSE